MMIFRIGRDYVGFVRKFYIELLNNVRIYTLSMNSLLYSAGQNEMSAWNIFIFV